ncbi:MAG: CsgG/HfaB family protein [Phycisphaerae bacterium]|nr:CsgG/HfaB family protein [Phycisphaerae bacterium]
MTPSALCRRTLRVLLAAGLSLVGGCSKKIWVIQTPDFYTPDLKTVAVVPFRDQSGWQGAGEIISDKLASALMANGAYQVFNRNDLRTVLDEQDLKIAFGDDTAAAATTLHKLGNVQAVLVGTVTTYSATTNSQQRQDPVYGYTPQGVAYVAGYRTYVFTRNEGNVQVTASLLRTADGTTIAATSEPAWARYWAEGSPPGKDPHACVADAASNVVAQLVEQFAPVRKQVTISASDALRTASELYDNKWTFTDTFAATDQKMYVVLQLPPACDRNPFKLTIVRRNQREDLAVQEFRWDKQYGAYGYLFNPSEIAAKGGGPGEYEVKFYSGPEPVLRRPFRIR